MFPASGGNLTDQVLTCRDRGQKAKNAMGLGDH